MAETTAVFDLNVFDFGFDVVDITPALLKVVVEREYRFIPPGQSVETVIYLIDNITTPGRQFPFTPSSPPTIEIYGPTDTITLTATPMRQSGIGIFSYTYPTTLSHAVGNYTAVFRCTNGSTQMITHKHVIFTIKEG